MCTIDIIYIYMYVYSGSSTLNWFEYISYMIISRVSIACYFYNPVT